MERIPEQDLRRWLNGRLGNTWKTWVEPTAGSTMGTPDLLILLPGQALPLPVELKVALVVRDRLRPFHVRPAQIRWHEELARSGGKSCFLFGVPSSIGWTAYVLASPRLSILRSWRSGFPSDMVTCVARPANPVLGVASLVLDLDAWKTCMALGQPHTPTEDVAGALKRAAR
jgi:hypothetical protein